MALLDMMKSWLPAGSLECAVRDRSSLGCPCGARKYKREATPVSKDLQQHQPVQNSLLSLDSIANGTIPSVMPESFFKDLAGDLVKDKRVEQSLRTGRACLCGANTACAKFLRMLIRGQLEPAKDTWPLLDFDEKQALLLSHSRGSPHADFFWNMLMHKKGSNARDHCSDMSSSRSEICSDSLSAASDHESRRRSSYSSSCSDASADGALRELSAECKGLPSSHTQEIFSGEWSSNTRMHSIEGGTYIDARGQRFQNAFIYMGVEILTRDGTKGDLRADGKIHWSDGDVWYRTDASTTV